MQNTNFPSQYKDFDALVAADMESLSSQSNPAWRNPEDEQLFSNSHPQEVFENTMDDEGNLFPDSFSFTDGGKVKGHPGDDDDADLYDAAQADFDNL
ncbi:uncharacterized protein BDV17DRAFT_261781 [Aspergillus undulatus]|uniref:uncharacterized protein n=1 Tax=Aspergillus undulatus TaxID=1810928 RepID=UPI003CCD3E6C